MDRITVGRGEIVDDLGDVGVVDRRAIGLDHFRHFGLPESCLNFGPARLGVDVIRGVKQKPGRIKRPGLIEMLEPRFDQYSQTLTVRTRAPNGVM